MKSKRFLFFSFLLLIFVSARADLLEDFTSSSAVNAPETAVLIADLKTGDVLAAHNADKSLIPASIMKCVTTATLLDKVGSRFIYETPVVYSGLISGNVLSGNVIVKASGDPSINTTHEPGSTDIVAEIVEALKSWKVDSIAGQIIVDESNFPGPVINPGWQVGDLPHAYGTGTHGFNFEDNASGKKSVADPVAVFMRRLKGALDNAGIKLGDNKINIRSEITRELVVHRSERIDDIMRSCMMRSDNQFAEALMRTVGLKYGANGATATGTGEAMNFWKRKNARMDGVKIVDGSGLSRSNRVTANFMADVLSNMKGNPYYASFFPLAGQEGTVKKFLAGTPLDGEIALKTGSMKGIQCYAGYKLNENYEPTHIVVVIMNQMGDRAAARASLEKLLLGIFHPDTDSNNN